MNPHGLGQRLVSLVLGAVVMIALVAAVLNPGVPATKVNLHDDGVWVTNSSLQMVAHLNYASRTLDAALRVDTKAVDVFQDGELVQVADLEAASVAPVDVARATLGAAVSNPGMSSHVGGGVAALAKGEDGTIWRQRVSNLSPVHVEQTDPDISGLPGAVTTVGTDGSIHAASARAARAVTLPADVDAENATTWELGSVATDADLQIAAVGAHAVVLDRSTGTVHLPSGIAVTVDGSHLQLQETGPNSDAVLVASGQGLHEIPLSGGSPVLSPVGNPGGNPTRPVRLGQCAYGAWTVNGAFLRDCDNDSDDVDIAVASLSEANQTRFRVNRNTIVLNDIDSGSLWLPDEKMLLVDDWDQVNSTLESEDDSDEDSAENADDMARPERAEDNTPPVAADDTFGVRAGRANVLPVIHNDSDADGDYMTVTAVTDTSLGELSIGRNGGAVHILVPPGTTGSSVFEYEISDGRGGVDRAQVLLTVHDDSINSPPEQITPQSLSLGVGRSATVNALANWYDPDGDPYYLSGVRSPNELSVRYRELGSLDVTENGAPPGAHEVTLLVSDGRDTGEGRLDVTMRGDGNLPPVTNTDHVVARRDSSVTVSPLENDIDPNGDTLRLVQVEPSPEGVEATMDGTLGTVSVTGREAGTYYLTYVATDGPATSKGFIRVDVVEPDDNAPPTAEDDIGVLPLGGQVLVDLLANDYDSGGGVLTVSQLDVPADSGLSVALLNRQVVRVTANNGLAGPVRFTYTISNGTDTATAAVTVIPGGPVDTTTPPELTDDKVVVRSGDVANVSVLDNDRSPVGLTLALDGELQYDIPAEVATVFQSDNTIRIRGGSAGGAGSIVYTVRDSAGNVASATLEFTVIPVDEASNTAPRPRNLVARTGAGLSVDIPVPLDGIDREGDSVVLLGIASSPSMGTVELKGNAFTYTASANAAGTDAFNYLVEDRLGRQATGTVRVGISPTSSLNQNPVTAPDRVEVRPGTRVAAAVLANDLDPDGDRISLVPDSANDHGAGLQVGQRGSRVTLTAPQTEGTHIVTYAVADSAGGRAEGLLTVVVDADAVLKRPIARDDALSEAQVDQARTDGRIVVQVLDNDEDPDGDINDVVVTSQDSTMTALGGGEVEITLLSTSQIVIYTITDPTGLSASAIIRVPGLDQVRPAIDTTNIPIRVDAGQSVNIPINDYVRARDDRQVMLTSEATVSAGVGADGSPLVVDRTTLAFRSTPEFSGPTSITFEVTDGESLNDPDGRTAVISLPIMVEASQNQLPILRPTAVQVGRGGDAVLVDLGPMASDPDADSLTFTMTGAPPPGITASISDATLSVQAGEDVGLGEVGQLPVTVEDGRGGSVQGSIPLTVIDSTTNAPLLQVTEAGVSMPPGSSRDVDVLNHVVSSAAAEGPVRLVGAPAVTSGGTASVSGTVITLQADAGFTGSFTATYVVVDGDGAASRQVTGVITATVLDRPAPPTGVSASATAPTTARVSWNAGAANGSPITGFTVTDHTQGDSVECGLVTSCLLSGRTPGVRHEFSVTATNAVGTSDASVSTQLVMDTVPGIPAAPTVTAGNGSAVISWNPPANQGSAILHYEVLLSPGIQTTVPASGSGPQSTTINGLTNGAEYVAKVRAVNAQGASEWSQGSAEVRPFGPPSAVTGVSSGMSTSFGQETGVVHVAWVQPNGNGRPIEYYTVTVGSISRRVMAAEGTSAFLDGIPLDGTLLAVTVTATNDGSRPGSYTSPPGTSSVWAVGVPHPPTIQSVEATGVDHQVRLNWSPSPAGSGWSPGELVYEWSAGGDWKPLMGNTLTGNGLSNGVSSSIVIRAVGAKTGVNVVSAGATSARVTPYGPPVASTMNCSPGNGSVSCQWSGGHGNGRGAVFTLSGAEDATVAASGSRSFSVSPGTEVRLCVTTTQEGTGVSLPPQCSSAVAAGLPPDHGVEITTNDLTVTMTFDDFDWEGVYYFRCWNATSPSTAVWPRHHRPGNYLGHGIESPMRVPEDGTITFTCAGNEQDPSMRPNSDFSVEFVELGKFFH